MTNLKELCIKEFGEADWRLVFDFYNKTLQVDCTTKNPDYKKKENAKKNMYIPSNERRFKHLKSLIEDYDKNIIIKAIQNFKNKERSGELSTLSMSYFGGFVKNEQLKAMQKNIKKPSFSLIPKVEQAAVKPEITSFTAVKEVKLERIKKIDDTAHEHLNWLYRCSCGSELIFDDFIWEGSKQICPKCKNIVFM